MDNAVTFGAQADHYAAARPAYPENLFDWIAEHAPGHNHVWDVGTGSGQAARALVKRFRRVHATDIDAAQIAQASPHKRITYVQADSPQSGLDDNSVDAVTVATALHWFKWDLFWPEVKRVARPGALFCAWAYHRAQADDEVQATLLAPVLDILAPYWSDGNRLSWRGYTKDELAMPFDVVETPHFTCDMHWTPSQIAAFVQSWSAHKRARLDGHEAELARVETEALAALGDTPRRFALPLNMLAARIR